MPVLLGDQVECFIFGAKEHIFGRFMGIDYYYLRASYPWPEQSFDPTYPVKWTSQFYTISDVSQVLYLPNLALCDAIDSKETLF